VAIACVSRACLTDTFDIVCTVQGNEGLRETWDLEKLLPKQNHDGCGKFSEAGSGKKCKGLRWNIMRQCKQMVVSI